MSDLHRLQADQLKLDDALPWDILDSSGTLLLSKGYVVRSSAQLEELLARGMYVDAAAYRAQQQDGAVRPAAYDPMYVMEVVQARLAWLLEAKPRDGSLAAEVVSLVKQVGLLVDKSADLAIASMQLLQHRNYPIAHSLHVAVLAEMLGRRAGWASAKREVLGCAALTMNAAMIELQLSLRNRREPLTAEQRAVIDQHPAEAVRILMQCGVQDNEWLRAVLEHHEQLDGSGYPRHVKNPSDLALVIGVCDVFTAKLSPRAYRKPVQGSEATRITFVKLGHDPANPWPAMLVKEVGIHPPGSLVRLANGEIGVVFRRGPSAKTPAVMSLINAKGMPFLEPVQRATEEPAYAIAAALPLDKSLVGLNFEQIWCGKRRDATQTA
jgi:HD-GYP domain-containing protein (c-di-GMP phosphodiesterase class II)